MRSGRRLQERKPKAGRVRTGRRRTQGRQPRKVCPERIRHRREVCLGAERSDLVVRKDLVPDAAQHSPAQAHGTVSRCRAGA